MGTNGFVKVTFRLAFICPGNCAIGPGRGSRCCRNLRRLTVAQGPARRGNECRVCPTSLHCTRQLTRQIDKAQFAGGSTKKELHLMIYSLASASARPASRTLAAIGKTLGQTAILTVALAAALSRATGSLAIAQQAPAAAPPAAKPKPPAKKPAPAPAAQTAPAPAAPAA